MTAYQRLIVELLQRYDILVIAPETAPIPTSPTLNWTNRWEVSDLLQRLQPYVLMVVSVLLIFIIGAAATGAICLAPTRPGIGCPKRYRTCAMHPHHRQTPLVLVPPKHTIGWLGARSCRHGARRPGIGSGLTR
ncbi:MAG: hypothetical protein HC837_11795 [Chloroflexaceae bacterium]|nr:hypothetical protein [Chloroflexaceae bacterium]